MRRLRPVQCIHSLTLRTYRQHTGRPSARGSVMALPLGTSCPAGKQSNVHAGNEPSHIHHAAGTCLPAA